MEGEKRTIRCTMSAYFSDIVLTSTTTSTSNSNSIFGCPERKEQERSGDNIEGAQCRHTQWPKGFSQQLGQDHPDEGEERDGNCHAVPRKEQKRNPRGSSAEDPKAVQVCTVQLCILMGITTHVACMMCMEPTAGEANHLVDCSQNPWTPVQCCWD